jgi:putative Mg2+ transporter-C (MgtC) family protein
MALVAMGSCLFSEIGVFVVSPHVDQTRVAAQVVTGIGFLGAGAILRDAGGIKGLTTAATVWVVAAIGMAVAFGALLLALIVTGVVLVALFVIKPVEERLFGAGRDTGENGPTSP